MRRLLASLALAALAAVAPHAQADTNARLQGVVHDQQHHPIRGAHITLQAVHSSLQFAATTGSDGQFSFPAVPLGDYTLSIASQGFAPAADNLTLASGTSPVLHFELAPAAVHESVSVSAYSDSANPSTATPITLVGREDIAATPGADRINSLAMITDYTPGAYMTHDMLHIRGGHQVSWLIDGVEIPNTNIASNLAAQIDPRDIDYLEVQRGSYAADTGDRTYGVFNIVPRSGFERDRAAELVLTAGNFLQTDDQLNLGDHSGKAAYYASFSANRSGYGLAPPVERTVHDQNAGAGGFASFIDNVTPADQLRLIAQARHDFFQVPYDPDPSSIGNSQYNSSGLRDTQTENGAVAAFSWLHTFRASTVLQVSPFFNHNAAAYNSPATDTPVATTVDRGSNYGGGQISAVTTLSRTTLEGGLYGFTQHDSDTLRILFNDGSGNPPLNESDAISGSLLEPYLSASVRPVSWITVIAGLRFSRFDGAFSEAYAAPRIAATVRIPRLNWVLRGFYGRFYQPPPLVTASGPVLAYAGASNTTLVPLHGERDEEHQFGLQIPYRGWLLDIDTFKTRANNFLDHASIGDSSLYFPVTVDGALIRAWELTLRSPRIAHLGQAHLAYSNQIAEQRGNITGGLICTPVGDPACDAGFAYTAVDHDQRNTLSAGFTATLPRAITASANFSYGSGFVNGAYDPDSPPVDPRYPNAYLPAHTSFDLALSREFSKSFSASVTATNLLNSRTLLDNSVTFGGFHYNDPRQFYAELRYRFHY